MAFRPVNLDEVDFEPNNSAPKFTPVDLKTIDFEPATPLSPEPKPSLLSKVGSGIRTGIDTAARTATNVGLYKPVELAGKAISTAAGPEHPTISNVGKAIENLGAGGQEYLKEHPQHFTKAAAGAPKSLGKGLLMSGPALTELGGQAAQYIGSKTGISPLEAGGKWLEEKSGEIMKPFDESVANDPTQKVMYEGAKMVGPSFGANIIGRGLTKAGLKLLPKVGESIVAYEDAAAAAKAAGNIETAGRLLAKAENIRERAGNVGSVTSMAGIFGAGQAQQTREAALNRAAEMEKAGDAISRKPHARSGELLSKKGLLDKPERI